MLRDLPQTWIILLQIASSSYFSPQSFIFTSFLFKISYVYVNSVTFWIFHDFSQIFRVQMWVKGSLTFHAWKYGLLLTDSV